MLGLATLLIGYGPSHYTLQGARRTINALGPNYYNGAYQGDFGFIINFFSINGFINTNITYEDVSAGNQQYQDGYFSFVDHFGLGIGFKYLEMAIGGSYFFEAWDKVAYAGRQYTDNVHSHGPGDAYVAGKIMLPFHGEKMSVSLGGSFIYTFPRVFDIQIAHERDVTKDNYVSDSRGWYQKGGVFRTFTYGGPSWDARFLFTFLPNNKYIELNVNVGYSPRNPDDQDDDVTLLGSSLLFHLNSFHPFFEVMLEDWSKGRDKYGDSPLYLTGGFNIETGRGVMWSFGIEKLLWYDGSTIRSQREGAPDLPEYVKVDPDAPAEHSTNILTKPNWWFITWNPQVGVWLALSYTFVPPYEKKPEKEKPKVKPTYIAGVVMDAQTQKMIGGAKVTLKEKDISVVTGDDGAYKFENLEPGSYTIRVEAPGYTSQSQVIDLKAGQPVIKNFELVPAKAYAIIGVVYDKATNAPIGGAKVRIKETGDSTITQDDGAYRFSNVPPGTYTLIFTAPGYEAISIAVSVESGSTVKNAYLSKAEQAQKVQKVEKPKVGSIIGVVQDAKTNMPLSDVQIIVKEKGITYTTDQTGAFRFDSLPEGSYTLSFSKDGYVARTRIVTVKAGSPTNLNISLSPVEKKVGTLLGKVIDKESGNPIAGAVVSVDDMGSTQTDQSGLYRLENIPVGARTVKVAAPGYKEVVEIIKIAKGDNVRNFALEPMVVKGSILITVIDKEKKTPISGATITFVNGNFGPYQTDANGTVMIKDIPAGTYTIKVSYGKYAPQQKTVVVEKGKVKEVVFELVKKGTEITFRNIYFDLNKATLRPDAEPALKQICQFLKENPTVVIEIQGHTDERGPASYNLRLSQARAEAVRQWLINNGCATPDRLIAKGYGESMPVIKNAKTEAEHQLNRRVVIKVIGEK
ncbi:MAG: OmpA family protein [Thermotogae bacterium]|nr:OmpA family protein [Thermotogota bacterium]